MSARGLALDDAAWSSPWRTRRVLDKAVLSLGLLACVVTLPAWPAGVLAGLVAAAIILGPARVRARLLARCLAAPLVFVVVGAVTILVTVSWDGGPRVGLAPQMLPTAGTLLVRGTAGALAVFLLATTTPMVDLFAALRRARIPDPLIEVASLVYRLVFVLLESARAIREAQSSRLGFASRAAAYRSLSALVAAVLVRSWTRARRLEEGLAGRGYTDALPTLDPPRHGSARFVAASILTVAVVAGSAAVPALLRGVS
ncbi:cobalt ECF transporter T component CbiQ [Mobilicoccus caccae]|uniref:Cobalt ECF transporter T component CbiQ n=1 Tax=Mobilicoccus caccae TaxID=1859295 RepID=A0ABQ6ITS9_9MICO|nr:cobalt ECF transporter T component CbiQ [Mobilicoccus caccae]GMA40124.1 cobalt ECF transporter T component CbiQ [Mobilicoccus caccae]